MIDYEINYAIAEECGNYDAMYTCLKCGSCGRVFDDDGVMTNSGGTTPMEDYND